jgi:hypothetical protein
LESFFFSYFPPFLLPYFFGGSGFFAGAGLGGSVFFGGTCFGGSVFFGGIGFFSAIIITYRKKRFIKKINA